MDNPLRIVCAWCDVEIQEGTEPASHGICSRCFSELTSMLATAGAESADRRRHERFPLWLEANLRLSGSSSTPALVADISRGGVLLCLSTPPPLASLRDLVLELGHPDDRTLLPLATVETGELQGRLLAHCKFAPLTGAQSGLVASLVAALSEERTRYQRYLANRRDDREVWALRAGATRAAR